MKIDSNISFAIVYLIFAIIQFVDVFLYLKHYYNEDKNYDSLLHFSFIKPVLLMVSFSLVLIIYMQRYLYNDNN